MLSKNDMNELRGMMREVIQENNAVFGTQLKTEIRDEMRSIVKGEVSALRRDMYQMRDDILDVINDGILSQIEEHRLEILTLKSVNGIA